MQVFARFIKRAWAHFRRDFARNVAALYGSQLLAFLFPVITVPYLARVLGVHEWGMVAAAQSFSAVLATVIDFGFQLSATRQVARAVGHGDEISRLLADVTGAKTLLALLAVLAAWVLFRWMPFGRGHALLYWAAVFAGIALGMNPLWYAAGRQRMRFVAAVEITAGAAATAGIFVLVHRPEDSWLVPALTGVSWVAVWSLGTLTAYRELSFCLPTLSGVCAVLAAGWKIFAFAVGTSLYTSGNSMILSILSTPEAVAYFAGAERIVRAAAGLLMPINRALYPRVSALVRSAPEEAAAVIRRWGVVSASLGAVLTILLVCLAPLLTRLALGPGYEPATVALRLLALLPATIAINSLLGPQWMFPLGMDALVAMALWAAAAWNIIVALLLTPAYGHIGMACAVASAEIFVTVVLFVLLESRGINPLKRATMRQPSSSGRPDAVDRTAR